MIVYAVILFKAYQLNTFCNLNNTSFMYENHRSYFDGWIAALAAIGFNISDNLNLEIGDGWKGILKQNEKCFWVKLNEVIFTSMWNDLQLQM